MCSPNFLLLRDMLGIGHSQQIVCCCAGGGVYGESVSAVSTCNDVGILSLAWCVGVAQTISSLLAAGVSWYIAVREVSLWEEGSSGASLSSSLSTPFSLMKWGCVLELPGAFFKENIVPWMQRIIKLFRIKKKKGTKLLKWSHHVINNVRKLKALRRPRGVAMKWKVEIQLDTIYR